MTTETARISCLSDEPAAETYISDVDGRKDGKTRRWIRVHYQDAGRKSAFFQHPPPLVVHRQHA